MVLTSLWSLASRVVEVVPEVVSGLVRSDRVLLALPGRVHLELRGVHRPGSESAARGVARALRQLDGVRRVEVLAPLGRVVVSHQAGDRARHARCEDSPWRSAPTWRG
ncbi:hypothetical protein JOF53_007337 [Crossiella equi]|uniref:Uncharacterized protein n=1 Tax=Crossiella equi TaxID=130796 RepID=A0ABS5ARZ3_9PSEU|nr:heavy metal-associated domain-containing protein [Crossiella equi]MBP2478465.1 hypothetical protein [Crossiella equi]